ncbi:hypothetical protein HanOQP8_Chr02g0042771 [Helianthus annuus]|nr:hypothetical protein HanOQP8_Chr02g0042771 [Helianthus annuus]
MSKNDNFGAEIVEANDDEDDSIDEDDDKPSRLTGTKSFGCVIVEEKDFMHGFKVRITFIICLDFNYFPFQKWHAPFYHCYLYFVNN